MKKNILSGVAVMLLTSCLLCEARTVGVAVRGPASCDRYVWGIWTDQGSTNMASATLAANGQTINMTMTANYNFYFTPNIYNYLAFNMYTDNPPNTIVPATTWSIGTGGTTKMCFSVPVQNPVLLLSSIGSPSRSVTLDFSIPYRVLFDGGGNTFVNSTSIIGKEGYAVIEFQGTTNCVTVFSSTLENYTNLTWGIKIPPVVNFTSTQKCQDGSIDFFGSIVNIINPVNIISWLWNFGDGITSDQQNPNHSYAAIGNYNTQLVVRTDINCTDTIMKTTSVSPQCQTFADFKIPDTVCVSQNFSIQNLSKGGSTYYWNFCSGSLGNTPLGENLGNIGNLNRPVYSSIIKDGANYYVFITNLTGGTISRLDFGNSLSNIPVGQNLGNFGILTRTEGIQIKKDNASGNWYALVAGFDDNYLARINFGSSLKNNTPTAENLGNIGNLMTGAHTLYTFEENDNWYTLVGNNITSRLTRLNFGTSLANTPTAADLGNIGALNSPVGFYPIQENGNWYMFVANQNNNTISRLDFRNSLTNQPTGVNLGNIGTKLNAPRSIIIIRDCGTAFGFIVNGSPYADSADDLVRITFPLGITSQPTGESLGNIANFSFPHHISQLFREGDSVYSLVTNVNNNTLSRFTFKGCTNPSIPSSNLKDPLTIKYDLPGTYNIRLVVDEGLPTQANVCRQIVVIGQPVITVTPSNPVTICDGEPVTLKAGGATSYSWSDGLGTTNTITVNPSSTTTYTVTGTIAGCSGTASFTVMVNPIPAVSITVSANPICAGNSTTLTASGATDYSWSHGLGVTKSITVDPTSTTTYTVTGTTTGCTDTTSNTITVNSNPTVSIEASGGLMIIDARDGTPPYQYSKDGTDFQLSETFTDLQAGTYTIFTKDINNCTTSKTITTWDDKITIPNFFTPNNDGVHDTWEITGIQAYPDATIQVYNRFGKLLAAYKGSDTGWNGRYNDTPLPSDDYWYVVKLTNNINVLKGHVTLKRL